MPHLLCVGGIVSLPWFSKELKMTYQRTTCFVASSLYLSFANQYSLGGGFLFPIVLVLRYKLSLCHISIKPDLLGFPGIGVFACGLHDHMITRFTSMTPQSQLIFDKSDSVRSRTEECNNHSHTLKLKNSEVIFIKGCRNFGYMSLNSS